MVTVVRVDRDTLDFIRFRAGLPLGSHYYPSIFFARRDDFMPLKS